VRQNTSYYAANFRILISRACVAAVYENRVRLIPLQARYRMQQHIGVVFLKSKERDPNLLALVAECRMYANRHSQPET